jgi:hypothetical protein
VDGKERLLSRKTNEVLRSNEELRANVDVLTQKITQLEQKIVGTPIPEATSQPETSPLTPAQTPPTSDAPQPTSEPAGVVRSYRVGPRRLTFRGPTVISFPVEADRERKESTVVLPSGSYVKARMLTGVEAPQGKTYPVLLQLDYAHIVPNNHRLDLSGCFMIVKATGNLSIERVEMQANRLSCVSQEGRMFERDVSGFIADNKDNSFAVVGSVNSKQDRVAATAFLASIVEGIGRAIQQAQTTSQITPLGGSQSILTGDQTKYIGAGGAANAAHMVTDWYLRQAQNLLPTINVGSGQEVWVIMQESVDLPKSYFQPTGDHHATYRYFTRLID